MEEETRNVPLRHASFPVLFRLDGADLIPTVQRHSGSGPTLSSVLIRVQSVRESCKLWLQQWSECRRPALRFVSGAEMASCASVRRTYKTPSPPSAISSWTCQNGALPFRRLQCGSFASPTTLHTPLPSLAPLDTFRETSGSSDSSSNDRGTKYSTINLDDRRNGSSGVSLPRMGRGDEICYWKPRSLLVHWFLRLFQRNRLPMPAARSLL
jgi:hypothetical protein